MARGGYQQPSNPAPVSGPGALSKRTDHQPVRNPGGMPYGENADFADIQSSAPMEKAPALPPVQKPSRRGGSPTDPSVTPLNAPTAYPNEPVTTGIASGPGAGPEVTSVAAPQQGSLTGILQQMAVNDPSGDVNVLLSIAQRYGW